MISTPELDRIAKVHDQSEIIGQFLEWLQDASHYAIGEWISERNVQDSFVPAHPDINRLLAEYYDIDLDKVDQERKQILDEIRRSHV